MSRSYKKSPISKGRNNQYAKRLANKRVRKVFDVSSGNSYKKYFESWEISDYKFRCSLLENEKYCRFESREEWSKLFERK